MTSAVPKHQSTTDGGPTNDVQSSSPGSAFFEKTRKEGTIPLGTRLGQTLRPDSNPQPRFLDNQQDAQIVLKLLLKNPRKIDFLVPTNSKMENRHFAQTLCQWSTGTCEFDIVWIGQL